MCYLPLVDLFTSSLIIWKAKVHCYAYLPMFSQFTIECGKLLLLTSLLMLPENSVSIGKFQSGRYDFRNSISFKRSNSTNSHKFCHLLSLTWQIYCLLLWEKAAKYPSLNNHWLLVILSCKNDLPLQKKQLVQLATQWHLCFSSRQLIFQYMTETLYVYFPFHHKKKI